MTSYKWQYEYGDTGYKKKILNSLNASICVRMRQNVDRLICANIFCFRDYRRTDFITIK